MYLHVRGMFILRIRKFCRRRPQRWFPLSFFAHDILQENDKSIVLIKHMSRWRLTLFKQFTSGGESGLGGGGGKSRCIIGVRIKLFKKLWPPLSGTGKLIEHSLEFGKLFQCLSRVSDHKVLSSFAFQELMFVNCSIHFSWSSIMLRVLRTFTRQEESLSNESLLESVSWQEDIGLSIGCKHIPAIA